LKLLASETLGWLQPLRLFFISEFHIGVQRFCRYIVPFLVAKSLDL